MIQHDKKTIIHLKNARDIILLEVRRLESCMMNDCVFKICKTLYNDLKTNDTEDWWIKKAMHGQFHMDADDKTER